MTPSGSDRTEPTWITRTLLDAMHMALIQQYGGSHGVHDGALIESALDRPRNLRAYTPDADHATLAASLCFGLVKNHGYRDGNKRTALAAAAVFLRMNGFRLAAPEAEAVVATVCLATDTWNEQQFADWLTRYLVRAD